MAKQSVDIDCTYLNWCEKCGVLHVANIDEIEIDASNCSEFYPNEFYFTHIESPLGYKTGGTRCCEGTLRIVFDDFDGGGHHTNIPGYLLIVLGGISGFLFFITIATVVVFPSCESDSKLNRDEQQNVYRNVTDVSTTEQVPQASQQMVAGTTHLPDYLLFVLGGISGFLIFSTIVTIVVFFYVKQRKEQRAKSSVKHVTKDRSQVAETTRRNFTLGRADFIKNNAIQTNSIFSDEATHVNVPSMVSEEDLYVNTCERYLNTNDLQPTACLWPNQVTYPVLPSTWLISTCRSEQIYGDDKPDSTLDDYIELC